MKLDVLNLEWTSTISRDREAATLICNYLRFQGYSVFEGSIFNGYHLIKKMKPKILFMTNTTGAKVNQQVARYAKKAGVIIITTISEGNIKKDYLDEMTWGHNEERIPFEDSYLLWNKKSYKMITENFPDLKKIIKISGSAGNDRYVIKNQLSKPKKSNNITIGIGCWGFDHFLDPDRSHLATEEIRNFYIDQRNKFDKILFELIKANQDCDFIIKEHPGNTLGYEGSAIESSVDFKNVKIYKNEKSVLSCIEQSDLWITYDSTTALEAWLLNKQTCILNPDKAKWPVPRDQMHKAQPIAGSTDEIKDFVDSIKTDGEISRFNKLYSKRKKIIDDVIEWNDGLNHVRAGNEIIDFINSDLRKNKIDSRIKQPSLYIIIKQKLKWFLMKNFSWHNKFSNLNEKHRIWNQDEVVELSKGRLKLQKEFYSKNSLDKESLKKIKSQIL